jgi:NAD(P) transhydrogenase subunit alpha
VLIGALVVVVHSDTVIGTALGIGAVALATINVVGGFMVTDRMLQMFKKRPDEPS